MARREMKRISLKCSSCTTFGLKQILEKTYKHGDVNYTVKCPKCSNIFQSGKPKNFWRETKKKYNLSPSEVRNLSDIVMETYLNTGAPPPIEDLGEILFIQNTAVIKRPKSKK